MPGRPKKAEKPFLLITPAFRCPYHYIYVKQLPVRLCRPHFGFECALAVVCALENHFPQWHPENRFFYRASKAVRQRRIGMEPKVNKIYLKSLIKVNILDLN